MHQALYHSKSAGILEKRVEWWKWEINQTFNAELWLMHSQGTKIICTHLVYIQPIINTLRMVGMFARKHCQGFTILIVQPTNNTAETGAHKISCTETCM